MKKLSRDTGFYAFSADLKPALEIEPDEKVQMETHDCFCGQIQTEADTVETLDWSRVNPATGPVYIRGARPGDVLAVAIEDVQVVDPMKTVRFEFPQSVLSAYGFSLRDLK